MSISVPGPKSQQELQRSPRHNHCIVANHVPNAKIEFSSARRSNSYVRHVGIAPYVNASDGWIDIAHKRGTDTFVDKQRRLRC
ncbi:hypothetical protein [Caballeronia zhejiangensis]|uniref:Uncharacterized protein n=2 Tax=Burkholderiaceae TaxID=119060 RepID=A0A656QGC9_9BURK|nr:hypothetical protein [Caballeronia zhejiangensis]KAK43942.1 hypothetical protein BG58_28505 [Caballeronia jiangsuensis]KDR28886.1 hypothetical protein BG60_09230 [Caballeronia zhejiangensis]